ncbi:MAG: hypothetical protein EOM59_04310 [Clostridia bacterium]|nr:hypothetical protein [Clostridia bacterium]
MSTYKIALVFVGSMIGAGFASGKEAWQFFGVFHMKGLAGIAFAIFLYCFLGYITTSIASHLKSGDIAKIICASENRFLQGFVGVMMCAFLLVAYVAMLAAGGALLFAQFGLHHAIGSLVYMFAAVLTALGGFEKVASRIGKVAPALVVATLVIGLYILFSHRLEAKVPYEARASAFASNWVFAAIGYVGYNMTAAVPVLGQCALRAKSPKTATKGVLIGGMLLGLCSLILFLVMLTNPSLAAASDLPMLSFSEQISPLLGFLYALFLLVAIFGAATTCFYGFTTKLGDVKNKNLLIWTVGISGYLFSLYGFSNFVANVYPLVGYISVSFFVMEIWNFFSLRHKDGHF